MTLGITGHQRIDHPENWSWVESEVRDIVSRFTDPIMGVSCLATGADQIFARVVLEMGGKVQAILPFPEYENVFEGESRFEYLDLLRRCTEVTCIDLPSQSDQDAYWLAGKMVVDRSEVLIAVWDGMPAEGRGGTGDVVTLAQASGVRVIQLNPDTKKKQDI